MEDHNRCELEVDLDQVNSNGRLTGSWLCCLPCYWLKRNTSFHKASLTVVTLLVTVLLVASPVLFLISSVPGDKSRECRHQESDCADKENERVCLDKECSVAANRILSSMSWKTNPCQDFYHFACGSWAKKTKKTKSSSQDNHPSISFDTLQQNVDRNIQRLLSEASDVEPFQKLGVFYQSCIQAGNGNISLTPMFSLLEELGGYVMPKQEPPQDLTNLLLSLFRLNGAPLFDIYLHSNPYNLSKPDPIIDLPVRVGFNARFWWHLTKTELVRKFRVQFTQQKLKFPSTPLNETKKVKPSVSKAYNFMKATLEEKRLLIMESIMQEFMPKNMSAEDKIRETHNTLLFANMVTKVYPREKDIIKNYEREVNLKLSLKDLQRKYPFVRWQFLLKEFFHVEMSSEDLVFVVAPGYLDNLQRILPRFSSRVTHNGLLLIYATDSLYELVNSSSTLDWPAFCTRITVSIFSKAVSILYVQQYGPEYLDQLQTRVKFIFNTLKKTFETRIRTVSWLDEKARLSVMKKLSALQGQFSIWPNFWNTTYAFSLLKDVHVDPDNFFENVIRRYQQLRSFPKHEVKEGFEEKRWAYPFVVNAFYILTMNTIIIPLAVLTQPYFREDVPLYIPYSTIGLIFAHEILHGFDLKGVDYDSQGKPGALLSPEARARLEARLDCFVKQFSSTFWKKVNFLGTSVDIQFDWNMTKNENMADISGLQMAYQAWKSVTNSGREARLPGVGLNPRQLFFLNAAQTYCSILSPADYIFLVEVDFHTPQPERVNGIMMNSPGFAEAYKCPLGSAMNPKKKCSTW